MYVQPNPWRALALLNNISSPRCTHQSILRILLPCCVAGEPNTKDSLLIAGDKLPEYLAGAYTLGDALADLCEVPALKAQLLSASSSVRRRQQQQQQPPGGCAAQRALLDSPFAQAAAAAVAAGSVSGHAAGQQNGVAIPAGAGAGAGAAAEAVADAEEDEAAAALAASVRVPRGFAIGSFSSKSLGQPGGSGSHPSLLQLLEREQQQQQQQLSRGRSRGPEADTAAAAAAGIEDDLQAGFADAYLDPPVPTADQLSLFTEVQRIVGRRRLRPVLHCKLHRMVFAMPFDDRIRITLDTDVQTMALVSLRVWLVWSQHISQNLVVALPIIWLSGVRECCLTHSSPRIVAAVFVCRIKHFQQQQHSGISSSIIGGCQCSACDQTQAQFQQKPARTTPYHLLLLLVAPWPTARLSRRCRHVRPAAAGAAMRPLPLGQRSCRRLTLHGNLSSTRRPCGSLAAQLTATATAMTAAARAARQCTLCRTPC